MPVEVESSETELTFGKNQKSSFNRHSRINTITHFVLSLSYARNMHDFSSSWRCRCIVPSPRVSLRTAATRVQAWLLAQRLAATSCKITSIGIPSWICSLLVYQSTFQDVCCCGKTHEPCFLQAGVVQFVCEGIRHVPPYDSRQQVSCVRWGWTLWSYSVDNCLASVASTSCFIDLILP